MGCRLGLILGVALVAGCASTPQVAYRAPQITIDVDEIGRVKLPLVQACVEGGGVVETNSDQQVVCAKPMDSSFGSIMFRALATPQYSTNPVGRVRYTIVDSGNKAYVTADMYLEYQTAFGQVNRMPMQNGALAAQAQALLQRVKSSIEGSSAIAASPADASAQVAETAPSALAPVAPTKDPAATGAQGRSDWRTWGQRSE